MIGGALRVVQAEDGQRGDALAGAGLAHDAEGATRARRRTTPRRPRAPRRRWCRTGPADHVDPQVGVLVGALLPAPPGRSSGLPGRRRCPSCPRPPPSVTKRTYRKVTEGENKLRAARCQRASSVTTRHRPPQPLTSPSTPFILDSARPGATMVSGASERMPRRHEVEVTMTAAVFDHDGPWTEEELPRPRRDVRIASNSSTGAST